MIYIFAGLPGAGKSTLSHHLALHKKAVYLRIDSIEQGIRNVGGVIHGPEGYAVGYTLAADNLKLGNTVVADSVNPIPITRDAWRDTAIAAHSSYLEIEVICSDSTEHRTRVETRVGQVVGLNLPTWKDVLECGYEAWNREHVVIDTAGQTIEQSVETLMEMLQ
jgi:predicted kinase